MTTRALPPLYLAWTDCETTGLTRDDHLLEVAVVLTDHNLRELGRLVTLVRPQPSTFQRIMANDFIRTMHTRSGLLAELDAADPDTLPDLTGLEQQITDLVGSYCAPGVPVHIAGGGVANFDKPFLLDRMPALADVFHYRPIDTSLFIGQYEAAIGDRSRFPKLSNADKAHRALDDVLEDLGIARAQWAFLREAERVLRLRSALRASTSIDHILAGASLIQATVDGAASLERIVEEHDPSDVTAGVTAIAGRLASMIADRDGRSVSSVLDEVRRSLMVAP